MSSWWCSRCSFVLLLQCFKYEVQQLYSTVLAGVTATRDKRAPRVYLVNKRQETRD